METINLQAQAFLWTTAAGIILGLFFDIYRLWRGWMRPGPLLTNLGDAAYWLVVAVVGAGMLLAANGGEIRLYVAIGALTGAAFYFATLSYTVLHVLIVAGRRLGRCRDAVFMVTDLAARSIVSDANRRLRPVSQRVSGAGRKAARWGRAKLAAGMPKGLVEGVRKGLVPRMASRFARKKKES